MGPVLPPNPEKGSDRDSQSQTAEDDPSQDKATNNNPTPMSHQAQPGLLRPPQQADAVGSVLHSVFQFLWLGEWLLDSQSAFNQTIHLTWGDVAVNDPANPTMLRIRLKQSKTDQLGSGADIILGRTNTDICPVAALLGYISTRGDRPGPFFMDSSAKPLVTSSFIAEVRKILVVLGLPQDHYAGHSFRIGAATSAALAGMEDSSIQLMGRWQSAAFLRYVRTPPEQLARLSATLAAVGSD